MWKQRFRAANHSAWPCARIFWGTRGEWGKSVPCLGTYKQPFAIDHRSLQIWWSPPTNCGRGRSLLTGPDVAFLITGLPSGCHFLQVTFASQESGTLRGDIPAAAGGLAQFRRMPISKGSDFHVLRSFSDPCLTGETLLDAHPGQTWEDSRHCVRQNCCYALSQRRGWHWKCKFHRTEPERKSQEQHSYSQCLTSTTGSSPKEGLLWRFAQLPRVDTVLPFDTFY